MTFLKRTVPIAIAFVVGLWFAVQYYVPTAWSDKSLDYASNWVKIISGVALALGLYSLCHVHWRRVRRRQPGFGYSILVYVGLLTMMYFGLVGEVRHAFEIMLKRPLGHHVYALPGVDEPPDATRRSLALTPEERSQLGIEQERASVTQVVTADGKVIGYSFDPHIFHGDPATGRARTAETWLAAHGVVVATDATAPAPPPNTVVMRPVKTAAWYVFASYQGYSSEWGNWFQWQFDYVFSTAQQTMFSMLGFFIASAAYRTFRARTLEAGVLLVAAVIVIFGRTTLAGYASAWFPDIAEWIMQYPNLAAQRGIMLGVALGSIATALRIIFGIERAYLGGD